MQTARIGVLSAVELRARVELGEHDLDAADFELGVFVDGDASPVVAHPCDIVVEELDGDGVAVAVCHLVDAVVDDFPKDVVHAFDACGADIHTGTLSDCVQALEHTDIPGFVVVICCHLPPLNKD